MSLQSSVNVGANISGSLSKAKTYANQVLQVGGTLTVNATDWDMTSANVLASKLNADVVNLSVVTQANTSNTHAWSVGVNTNGNMSFQNNHNRAAQIGTASGMSVGAGGINLNTTKMYLEGGKLVSSAGSHIHAEVVESKSVAEYNRGSSYGFNGNIHDVMKVQPIPQWQQGIPSVAVSLGNQNYIASQLGTVSIPNGSGLEVGKVIGNLNTTNDNGLVVKQNDHYNVQVKVPILSNEGIKQVQDNFNWLHDRFFKQPKSSGFVDINSARQNKIKSERLDRWRSKEKTSSKPTAGFEIYSVTDTEQTENNNNQNYTYQDVAKVVLEGLAFACAAELDLAVLGGVALYKLARNGLLLWRTAEQIAPDKILTPEQLMRNALERFRIMERIDEIEAANSNASRPLNSKLSQLSNLYREAEEIVVMPNGSIRFYKELRKAKTEGETVGSKYVTEYDPITGNVMGWNENYGQNGLVNRISIKNIDGLNLKSWHFPPTQTELLSETIRAEVLPTRRF